MSIVSSKRFRAQLISAAFTCATILIGEATPIQAQSAPGVTVNGQPVTLTPPPILRAGRLFVPLRGVFEQLGATVVYLNGQINATAGSRTVALSIGSTQASVGGQPQQLDVAPFVVGASTYVPLRFVSQALGADVQYDGANQLVAIITAAPPSRVVVTPQPARPPGPPHFRGNPLHDEEPPSNATVSSTRPTISTGFVQPADPNSVRIALDGLDITGDATRSPSGFIFAPPSPLQNTGHEVVVEGRFGDGELFRATWHFTSGTEVPRNSVHIDSPHDEDGVPGTFVLAGRTAPNARVRITAGARAQFEGRDVFGAGTYTGDTFADPSGRFSQQVILQTVPGAYIGITVHSTDPQTKESAEARLNLRAQ